MPYAGTESEFSLPMAEESDTDERSSNTGHTPEGRPSMSAEIAAKENTQVRYSRLLVMFVLACSALGVGYLTFSFVTQEEEDDFKTQFANDAEEISSVTETNEGNVGTLLGILSLIISSWSSNAGTNFPNFTLPDFEQFASGTRTLTKSALLVYSPLVQHADRPGWEAYSVENQDWIDTSLAFSNKPNTTEQVSEYIYYREFGQRQQLVEKNLSEYAPIWQMSPPPEDVSVINYNLLNSPTYQRLVDFANTERKAALSEVLDARELFGTSLPENESGEPQSIMMLAVNEEPYNPQSRIVGHLVAVLPWSAFFDDILADSQSSSGGIFAVVEDSCGTAFTYSIDNGNATFLGMEDKHDRKYDYLKNDDQLSFLQYDTTTSEGVEESCTYHMHVYPSADYENNFTSKTPVYFTVGVLAVFTWVAAVFSFYDCLVQRRQEKVNTFATKSNAIVASLFPAQVREKLINEQREPKRRYKTNGNASMAAQSLTNDNELWNSQLEAGGHGGIDDDSPPIADLFPSATVAFMDIAGFTAWSSQREPSQVFILLETIYRNFDKIATKRKVFKVETIGDCYVAVCGLPEPNDDHAVVMARFARDCLEKMNEMARKLEATLGPDTANLAMRAGLHSGPVTAGVLRGDRARFQLFGDTVNTAARMESTGTKRKIQISQETAELIIAANHPNWVKPRQDIVVAKGKGEMQTYWLLPQRELTVSVATSTEEGSDDTEDLNAMMWMKSNKNNDAGETGDETTKSSTPELDDKVQRLVDYTSDILLQILKKIVAKRGPNAKAAPAMERRIVALEESIGKAGICLDEVEEIIELPNFDQAAYQTKDIEVSQEVVKQLVSFVKMVASMYQFNPFHNFEHASHVTQSTSKLLSRIVAMKHIDEVQKLHDHTYGITSDPLTQFAVVFSSLIHDVDHRGVPNFLLVKEEPALGSMYRRQAVAEQNSVDVAWNLLMDPSFTELRRTIYTNVSELRRFRVLVVNCLMATDIFDKELAALRKARWENAFFGEHKDDDSQISINRKATIVIEHIIQASDVAHTMQHWHVYSKWNERLYAEMFTAYCTGRSNKDPTQGWYEGELWFFDNYVIPLAHKLKECGVFGVSSDEYLNYALANRSEWEKKGKVIVASNFERFKKALDNRPQITKTFSMIDGDLAPLPNKHE
eukprot:CAMPEP_0113601554 /NCGR_PEP_ID=MMETSP0017_2-20120614/292_1 /TAXON_ID=2856 /ORGANISM="Cylindrotheca closterium" /LENGTH=1159 /DNA_ID=CAMNT_0000509857 /DNA_START=105 /DNA_END=3584 /DNA_ORIENTATION=- /assembly_acc=CAM_ASM_000147